MLDNLRFKAQLSRKAFDIWDRFEGSKFKESKATWRVCDIIDRRSSNKNTKGDLIPPESKLTDDDS